MRHGRAKAVSEVEVRELLDSFAEEVGGEEEGEEEEENGKDDLSQGPPELEAPEAIGTDTFKFPFPGVVVSVETKEKAAGLDFEENETESPGLVEGEKRCLIDGDTRRNNQDQFEEEADEKG